MKHNRPYLEHIVVAVDTINTYMIDASETRLRSDQMLRDAVVRQLEIIGEATKRLDEATQEKEPSIPWRKIAGMRDMLIHHYMDVEVETVWLTCSRDLPPLREALTRLLDDPTVE